MVSEESPTRRGTGRREECWRGYEQTVKPLAAAGPKANMKLGTLYRPLFRFLFALTELRRQMARHGGPLRSAKRYANLEYIIIDGGSSGG